jgi:ubiquinone/menaquinone biosynthesis methyltransferase
MALNVAKSRQALLSDPDTKRDYNRQHFAVSAPKYDMATRFLSFFQDAQWKRLLLKKLANTECSAALDLACGTGDLTFALAEKWNSVKVTGLDITPEMLEVAQVRASSQKGDIEFVLGDICSLPFADNSFDIVTGSYALRNAPALPEAVAEIVRVLRPGGTIAILDFAKPDSVVLQRLQQLILSSWGGLCGVLLHADPRIHSYIAASLLVYPSQSSVIELLKDNGLRLLERKSVMFGNLEILIMKKS